MFVTAVLFHCKTLPLSFSFMPGSPIFSVNKSRFLFLFPLSLVSLFFSFSLVGLTQEGVYRTVGSNIQVQKLLNAFFGEEMAQITSAVCMSSHTHKDRHTHSVFQFKTNKLNNTNTMKYKHALFLVKRLMFYVDNKFNGDTNLSPTYHTV